MLSILGFTLIFIPEKFLRLSTLVKWCILEYDGQKLDPLSNATRDKQFVNQPAINPLRAPGSECINKFVELSFPVG